MKRHTLLIIAFLMLAFAGRGYAQFRDFEDDNGDGNQNNNGRRNTQQGYRLMDHLRFGGDCGLGFGTGTFAVQFNPQVGYYFNQYVTAGLIGTYEYFKYSSTYNSVSRSVYGGGLFVDAHPLEFLVAHAEAQAICYDNIYGNAYDPEKKVDVPILVGGGYHRQVTERASVNIMLLWNLNATTGLENNTSFSNPVFRINILF